MKIVIVSQEYAPDAIAGGIGTHLAGYAPALVARGHDVHVLSCVPHQPISDVEQDGVHVHRRRALRLIALAGQLAGVPAAGARLRAAVTAFHELRRLGIEPDVVQFPEWMAEGLLIARRGTVPTVVSLATPLHMTNAFSGIPSSRNSRWGDRLERTSARRATAATSTSRLLERDLAAWLQRDDTVIIPPPVDTTAFADVPPPSRTAPVILSVGRLEHRKGLDIIVEAAALLQPDVPEVEVVLVGRSNGERDGISTVDWLRRRVDELGVRCRFAGQQPRESIAQWYADARVIAVPSRYDSFSLAALEAMTAGRPVVCTSAVGASELMVTAPTLVVPPEDPAALAEALLPFLRDTEAAVATGALLRQVVTDRCSPERIAAEFEALYERAIAAHRGRRAAA
jgi:glycogen(starch) synthase